jgi:Fe2+ or Zn2+ uptake regulation protein
MTDLRSKVIAVICEEAWPHPDNEVSSASIHERLKQGGENATESQVQQVLFQLRDQGYIELVADAGRDVGFVVQSVDYLKLCPQS